MIGRTGWVVALVALAGCGGSEESPPADSDREQIEATIGAYFEAMGEGDGEEACSHLTSSARKNLVTASGKSSCEEAIELIGEAADAHPEQGERLSQVRVLRATIDGVKAEATIKAGDRQGDAPVPLEKTDDGWKVAGTGTSTGVQYSSQAQAECVAGGMQEFDDGNADPFWKVEGRDDFRDYIAETCRIADRRGLLDGSVDRKEFMKVAGEVVLRMVESGQIRDPR
jgi:hypothetical protein